MRSLIPIITIQRQQPMIVILLFLLAFSTAQRDCTSGCQLHSQRIHKTCTGYSAILIENRTVLVPYTYDCSYTIYYYLCDLASYLHTACTDCHAGNSTPCSACDHAYIDSNRDCYPCDSSCATCNVTSTCTSCYNCYNYVNETCVADDSYVCTYWKVALTVVGSIIGAGLITLAIFKVAQFYREKKLLWEERRLEEKRK